MITSEQVADDIAHTIWVSMEDDSPDRTWETEPEAIKQRYLRAAQELMAYSDTDEDCLFYIVPAND
jgi:hypothetical protein